MRFAEYVHERKIVKTICRICQKQIFNRVGIPLTQGRITWVSPEDALVASQYKWNAKCNRKGGKYYVDAYIKGTKGKGYITLHRLLTKAKPGEQVDHKDGDTFNNTRENLRICSGSQNRCNSGPITGRYKGISMHKSGKWLVLIAFKKKRKYVGVYDSEEEAARAYDKEAKEMHGEFAQLNFPEPEKLVYKICDDCKKRVDHD